jgi:hypothetical protein
MAGFVKASIIVCLWQNAEALSRMFDESFWQADVVMNLQVQQAMEAMYLNLQGQQVLSDSDVQQALEAKYGCSLVAADALELQPVPTQAPTPPPYFYWSPPPSYFNWWGWDRMALPDTSRATAQQYAYHMRFNAMTSRNNECITSILSDASRINDLEKSLQNKLKESSNCQIMRHPTPYTVPNKLHPYEHKVSFLLEDCASEEARNNFHKAATQVALRQTLQRKFVNLRINVNQKPGDGQNMHASQVVQFSGKPPKRRTTKDDDVEIVAESDDPCGEWNTGTFDGLSTIHLGEFLCVHKGPGDRHLCHDDCVTWLLDKTDINSLQGYFTQDEVVQNAQNICRGEFGYGRFW